MKLYNITYFLREGVTSIFSHRLMSIAAMSVIMACLLLMGSFSLVVSNIENLLGDIEKKNQIVAYVDENWEYEVEDTGVHVRENAEVTEATSEEVNEETEENSEEVTTEISEEATEEISEEVTEEISAEEANVNRDETQLINELEERIGKRILQIQGVDKYIVTTKTQALEEFRKDFGEEGEILNGIEERNPLRHRFTITLKDIENTQSVADELKKIDGIAKVTARNDIAEKMMEVSDVTTLVCTVLILILVLVSVFIISNTVNITMFNRREEIAIMKMIGATNSFVRIPFIVEGVLIGIAGATFALLLQWAIYDYVIVEALSTLAFMSSVPFSELVWGIIKMFYGVATLVGGLGSVITLRKFLKV
ncbi:MAG: ABC transporter permease [Oscillospiraceae bacterium]|nr:ABC transporter permease [Oscillospiraceae bacterium]